MKKLFGGLIGFAAVSALTFSASAADLGGQYGYKDVPYVVPTWTGFYAGVNGGGGWSSSSNELACTSPTCTGFSGGPFGGVGPSGGFGGVQFGYNWQGGFGYSALVLGVETDIQASSILGEASDGFGNTFQSKLEDFGTVRGRIGYAMDNALVYFTGGFAYGAIRNEANLGSTSGADFITNPTATGYVLGGGLEYRFNRSLSIKGEYQYINLGTNDPVDVNGSGTFSSNGGSVRDDAFHTFRVGLNWFPFPVGVPLK